MAADGLTGAGGGSIAGTAPPPLQKQPDSALLASYAKAGAPKPDVPKREGGGDKAGADAKAGHLGDGWAQSEEQSRKLQDFDAVKGRPSLGDERRGDGQEGGEKREGSFVGCAAGAAKNVVVDTAKGAYETVKDAGGAVLDKAGVGGFEGHAERTAARAETVKDAVVDEGAEIMAEIEKGDSCALGERVGTTVGVGATVVIPGDAAVKGAKVLAKIDGADGPDAKPDAQDAGKAEKAEANDAGKVEETKKTSARPKVSVGHILDGDINAKG